MALPQRFETHDDYFKESLDFFREFQCLYNFANVEILVKNVLDHINIQNLDNIDIYTEDFDLENIEDEFLNRFFEKLKRLRVYHKNDEDNEILELGLNVPLGPKKKHEIVQLVKQIMESCQRIECKTVVDFGSGLGYLDQLLFNITNFKILGLECNESNYVGAKKRQRKYHGNSLEHVKYICHTITEQSGTNIKEFLKDKFEQQEGYCITGLHACADLTIDALNIFLKNDDAKCLVLMPCCYHKMTCTDEKFKNFPLSNILKKHFKEYQAIEFSKVPFLRLGAQPPNKEEKLEDSVFNLLARAVLEQYAWKHNCKLRRNKRKAVKTKVMDKNFENYVTDAANHGFSLLKIESIDNSDKVEFNIEELKKLWLQIEEVTAKKAGVFILLQNCLQPVIENFILLDRLVYLKENNIQKCEFKKIFNSDISPRCLALLASK